MRDVSDAQLGHRLAQLREQAGAKQAELARRLGWSQAVLSRVETGERPISPEELSLILSVIGTDEAAELARVLERDWQHLPTPALDHADQYLLWRAEQLIGDLVAAGNAPDVPAAFQTRLDEYVKEISRAADLLLRREHRFAFIGSIGIGKSTAICRATGLETFGPQGSVVPVLEAGAGGVTLCEVHLRSGPGYGIVVEPRSHDDIRSDVEDFVEQILQSQPAVSDADATPAVPRELERAIRNMADLAPKRTKVNGKTVRTDPAKELAAEFPDQRDLVVEVLTRMRLHQRDRRDEWHGPALADAPLAWMKSTFEQVNNGRHQEFSLPARIELVVPEVLEIGDLDVSIVDTRGIDQLSARADLEALLEDSHSISILCSGFNDAPSQAIQHLLKRARDINNTQIESSAGMLVLARSGEALAVKDESGSLAETAEEGYELKGEQVCNALIPYKLEQMPTFFFNALEDSPDDLRAFLGMRLTRVREHFRRQMNDVLERTQSLLDNAEREQVQAVQREAGGILLVWIKRHQEIPQISGRVHDTLLAELEHAHASTVNASVRREGEWRSLSYTHQLSHGARKIAVAALGSAVTEFSGLCETLADSKPEASELLAQARQLMAIAYDELLRKMQLTGLTAYREQLRDDSGFWSASALEWGRGKGYLDRVLKLNREWFLQPERRDLEHHLEIVLQREWSAALERVEAILSEA